MPIASLIERLTDLTPEIEGDQLLSPATGYHLDLLIDLEDATDLPSVGHSAVIIARIGEVLCFRVFDAEGQLVADTSSAQLGGDASRRVEDLRKRLQTAWPPQKVSRIESERIIGLALSIVGYTRPREITIEELRESVRQALSWVLNTKRGMNTGLFDPDLERLGTLGTSLWTYGIPDFTPLTLDSWGHREVIRAHIEEAIRRFDTRLRPVEDGANMVICHHPTAKGQSVHYEIVAMLKVDPTPVRIRFDSELDPNTRSFVVRSD